MIGDVIRSLRKEAHMTQEELANKIHVSKSAVGMYEKNRRVPGIDIIKRIALEFKVTINYIYEVPGDTGVIKNAQIYKKQILESLTDDLLQAEDYKEILQYINLRRKANENKGTEDHGGEREK